MSSEADIKDIRDKIWEMNDRDIKKAQEWGGTLEQISHMMDDIKEIKNKAHAPASVECPLTERLDNLKTTVLANYASEQKDIDRLDKAIKRTRPTSRKLVGAIAGATVVAATSIIEVVSRVWPK